jgi:HEPN domain-containing protein
MKKIVREWLDKAKEDLETAREIRDKEFLTNITSFHAQQTIEKCFKAIIEAYEIDFIKEHNLETLYFKIIDHIDFEADIELLKEISKLYMASRYPGEWGLLPEGKPSLVDVKKYHEFAIHIYNKTLQELENSNS